VHIVHRLDLHTSLHLDQLHNFIDLGRVPHRIIHIRSSKTFTSIFTLWIELCVPLSLGWEMKTHDSSSSPSPYTTVLQEVQYLLDALDDLNFPTLGRNSFLFNQQWGFFYSKKSPLSLELRIHLPARLGCSVEASVFHRLLPQWQLRSSAAARRICAESRDRFAVYNRANQHADRHNVAENLIFSIMH